MEVIFQGNPHQNGEILVVRTSSLKQVRQTPDIKQAPLADNSSISVFSSYFLSSVCLCFICRFINKSFDGDVGIGFESRSEISPYLQHKLNTGLDVFFDLSTSSS